MLHSFAIHSSFATVTWMHHSSWTSASLFNMFSVYLSSIYTCPQLFSLKLPSLFWFISPSCSLSLTYFSSLFLCPKFSTPRHCLYSFLLPFFILFFLWPSSLSYLRGCWRSCRIWRPQFCLRRRESLTWRISFPSSRMALTDVKPTSEELVYISKYVSIQLL